MIGHLEYNQNEETERPARDVSDSQPSRLGRACSASEPRRPDRKTLPENSESGVMTAAEFKEQRSPARDANWIQVTEPGGRWRLGRAANVHAVCILQPETRSWSRLRLPRLWMTRVIPGEAAS